jgi:multimeric flavodoxin WrbA
MVCRCSVKAIYGYYRGTLGAREIGQQNCLFFCYLFYQAWGQETTITAINNAFYHWGSIIVSPGYADPIMFQSGNPYGASFTSNNGELKPDETARAAARFQGRRVAEVAAQFLAGKR